MINFHNIHQNITILPFSSGKNSQSEQNRPDYYGQIQYFYSDPDSDLPVRDVCNKQKAGYKTEPHIEIGAENFLKPCAQFNVKGAINRGISYLFLVTRCMNKRLKDFFSNQYIVGYIKINDAIERQNSGKKFTCAKGEVKIVSYKDAIPVKDLFGLNFSRSRINSSGKLDKKTTEDILERLKNQEDITDKCIDEIIKLDENDATCMGKDCGFSQECKRIIKEN